MTGLEFLNRVQSLHARPFPRAREKGVQPVYCGENGRQNALEYAKQRMGYGRCDIQVLDENWNVVETITNEDLKPVI